MNLLLNSYSLSDEITIGDFNLWQVILLGDFMPDLNFRPPGALKYWHVIPTGALRPTGESIYTAAAFSI